MDKDQPLKIARLIAQEVMTSYGRTPVERVLRQHSQSINEWRELGWTWGQIATLLTKGGLRLKDGTAVTERYLAAVFSRIMSTAKQPSRPGTFAKRGQRAVEPTTIPAVRARIHPEPAAPPPPGKSKQPGLVGGKNSEKERLRARMTAATKARSDEI